MGGVRVSEKHGVNPSIPLCYFCGEDKNEVALLGKLKNDAEAPRHCLLDMEPCDTCAERRKTHVHLVVLNRDQSDEVEDQRQRWQDYNSRKQPELQRPFMPVVDRAGYTFWIDRDKIEKIVTPPELARSILSYGWTFIPVDAVEELGLLKVLEEAQKAHPDAKEIICRDVETAPGNEESPDADAKAV